MKKKFLLAFVLLFPLNLFAQKNGGCPSGLIGVELAHPEGTEQPGAFCVASVIPAKVQPARPVLCQGSDVLVALADSPASFACVAKSAVPEQTKAQKSPPASTQLSIKCTGEGASGVDALESAYSSIVTAHLACGENVSVVNNPPAPYGWDHIRTPDGKEGYITQWVVGPSTGRTPAEGHTTPAPTSVLSVVRATPSPSNYSENRPSGDTRRKESAKPWPKICLTKGCEWQEIALASSGLAGTITMAERNQGSSIQTADALRREDAFIEGEFKAAPDGGGYVPFSSAPQAFIIQAAGKRTLVDFDKLYGADRSVPIRPEDAALIASIFDRIRSGPYRVTDFHWTIVPTNVVNSSSFPDPPFVNVYSAILDFTGRDPDELAFVLAHEIGHTIDAQACSGSGMAHNASFGIPQVENQFFKFCENHADNIGLQLMVGAGYNPRGAIRLFQKLEAYQTQQGMTDVSAFLGNHPLNASRIQNIERILPIILKQAQAH
jgi:Peptidase family M48